MYSTFVGHRRYTIRLLMLTRLKRAQSDRQTHTHTQRERERERERMAGSRKQEGKEELVM